MKFIESHVVYKGKRVILEEATYLDKKNNKQVMEHVYVKPAVAILAITDQGNFVFIEERRTAINNQKILEMPAGLVEENESFKEAAIRELREETGYVTDNVEFLTSYYSSCGFTNEKLYIFLASNLREKVSRNLDDAEEINVKEIKKEDVFNMLKKGDICNASSKVALLWYKLFKEEC